MSKKTKVIISVLCGIFFLYNIISDTSTPEITLSDGDTLVVDRGSEMTSDQLVEKVVSSINDNKSDMSIDDISVDGFDSIDFETVGDYNIILSATDEADNKAVVNFTVTVKLSEEEQAEQEAAEQEAAAEAEKTNRENGKALATAQDYINIMAFSEEKLKEQLDYEGFTSDQINYAVKNVNVDWNQEAVESAQGYSDTLNMSSSAIYDQLIYEGFTEKQAQYGVDNY